MFCVAVNVNDAVIQKSLLVPVASGKFPHTCSDTNNAINQRIGECIESAAVARNPNYSFELLVVRANQAFSKRGGHYGCVQL